MVTVIQPNELSSTLRGIVERYVRDIGKEAESRAFRASNELANASTQVLRGQRSGRRYKIPGTYRRQKDKVTGKMRNGVYYTASAPGESPAVRTGVFRAGWKRRNYADSFKGQDRTIHAVIQNDQRVGKNGAYLLGEILEHGRKDGIMKPRPYKQKIRDMAMPKITRIYKESYKRSLS